jgi:hypothetical protein
MKMIGRHSYSSAWRDFHEIRPFGSILRRLQMPTIIAIQTLSFIRTKKFDEDLLAQLFQIEGWRGRQRNVTRRERTHCILKELARLKRRSMVAPFGFSKVFRLKGPDEFALETPRLGVDQIGKTIAHMRGNRLSCQCFRQSLSKLVGAGCPSLHVTQSRHCGPPLWATFV